MYEVVQVAQGKNTIRNPDPMKKPLWQQKSLSSWPQAFFPISTTTHPITTPQVVDKIPLQQPNQQITKLDSPLLLSKSADISSGSDKQPEELHSHSVSLLPSTRNSIILHIVVS